MFVFLLFCYLIIQPKKKNEEGFGIPDDWDNAEGWSNSIEEYAKYNVFTTIFSLFGSKTSLVNTQTNPTDSGQTNSTDPNNNQTTQQGTS